MKKYEKYKDSGIEWLGMIPEHWSVSHLKRVCKLIKDGTHGSFRRVDSGFPLLSVRNIVDNMFTMLDDDSNISERDYLSIIKTFKVQEGDLQLAIVGATLGKVGLVPKLSAFATQRSVATIRTSSKVLLNKYLFYLIQGVKFQKILWANANYSAQPGIYLNTIENISVFLPPLSEQNLIANYLDSKTQLIDKKIELLNKKISYYKELRRSLINKVVCRGLDDSVKLKDSGIDWIGKIPEHWEVIRFKGLANTLKGKNLEYHDSYFEKSLPNLSLEYLRNNTSDTIDYCFSLDKNLIANEQDLIIIWDGAGVGEILKAKKGYVSSTIAKLHFTKKCNSSFFYFLKDNLEYTLKSIPTGMGIPHLNPVILNNYKFPIPPQDEQKRITDYLEKKTLCFENIISNLYLQITKLQELRKTLINDVVTGKMKVIE